jgi:hypothetical protein
MAVTPPVDPCSLFSADQVSTALEAKAGAGAHVVATLCAWEVASPSKLTQARKLTVGFLDAAAWEQTKALRESMKSFTRTTIQGLGEEAVFSTYQSISTLQVKKGRLVLDMHLYGFTPEQAKPKEVALAGAALAKL